MNTEIITTIFESAGYAATLGTIFFIFKIVNLRKILNKKNSPQLKQINTYTPGLRNVDFDKANAIFDGVRLFTKYTSFNRQDILAKTNIKTFSASDLKLVEDQRHLLKEIAEIRRILELQSQQMVSNNLSKSTQTVQEKISHLVAASSLHTMH